MTTTTTTIQQIKTVCAWCNVLIHDGDDSKGLSHGMCQACCQKEFSSIYDLIKK